MPIHFRGLPTNTVQALWSGGRDAYGQMPETHVSDGDGMPCRHCLGNIDAGQRYMLLAHRPFPHEQPFAETGPIFLHAEPCNAYSPDGVLPQVLTTSPDYILRGYSADHRIVYGTGKVTERAEMIAYAEKLMARPDIAYVHVRSARNNCFQCEIVAAS
jgi:Protein of unknown function (DUF1203)